MGSTEGRLLLRSHWNFKVQRCFRITWEMGDERWCLLTQDSWAFSRVSDSVGQRRGGGGAHPRMRIFIKVSGDADVAGPGSSFSVSLLLVVDFFVDPSV